MRSSHLDGAVRHARDQVDRVRSKRPLSGAVPVVRLTEVFRQAAQSRIIINAHRINQGTMPDLSPPGTESDFYFVDPEIAVGRIIELVKTRIPKRFGLDPATSRYCVR
jgi:hypothetical protein